MRDVKWWKIIAAVLVVSFAIHLALSAIGL